MKPEIKKPGGVLIASPFDLENATAYEAWRQWKLENYPSNLASLIVEVKNPANLSASEHVAIRNLIRKTNMAIYAGPSDSDGGRQIPARLGAQFGLTQLDDNMGADEGITSLQVARDQWRGSYIPYTNKPIHWHTDGYYNTPQRQILALLLHCVRPANAGGENALLDHEIAYIHLRDQNPEYIAALMRQDAMTIPANIKDGRVIRATQSGPVFSVLADGGLHMRYTARSRSIEWHDDTVTRAATSALNEFLNSDSEYIFRATLQPGQGLISNNVLHDRSGFEDSTEQPRLLYRLRYYQKITTGRQRRH